MRIIFLALGLLIACTADEAAPTATPSLHPMKIAFVSHCRFSNGAHILLAHKFGSDTYRFIISHRENNDLSTIRFRSEESPEIETNGGVGKIIGIESLFNWLLKQSFHVINENAFTSELERNDVLSCPGTYPFSP